MKRVICVLNILIILLLCCCGQKEENLSIATIPPTETVQITPTPLITATPAPTEVPTPTPIPFDENAFTIMYVKGDGVNVRSLPSTDGKALASFSKNALMKCYGEEDGWYYISYEKGKFGYIRKDLLSETPVETPTPTPTPTPAPKATATPKAPSTVGEDNVPQSYSGKYVIKVNLYTNRVYVYKRASDGEYTDLVKAFICSVGTGPDDDFTPTGSFYTTDKYQWRSLFGGTYGRYAMRIHKTYLFHSVPYTDTKPDALKSAEFNKLGVAASQGCIRMAVRDAKWLYDNCAKGTFVYIYEKDETGPAYEPVPKIDLSDPRCNWDPTDPDPKNPWKE